ncbi:hypothetical protein HYW75_04930 [Candidatus Pacearchaeota archaeon]|nr:hypothetical protein [Candidatus Pacearchaeota archaeon]
MQIGVKEQHIEDLTKNTQMNVEEGSITFWIDVNKVKYNDNQATILLNWGNKDGSLFIVKDSDNKLKFFHVYYGFGRTDAEIDVRDLSSGEKHMVAVTWSVPKKEINLYIDGGKRKVKSLIKY